MSKQTPLFCMFFLKVNTHGHSLCISLFSWRNPKTTILLKRQVFTILTCFASKRLWCGENGANLATCYGLSSVVIGAFDCNWNIRIIHGIASPPHPIVTAVPSECISRFSGRFCLFPNLISTSQLSRMHPLHCHLFGRGQFISMNHFSEYVAFPGISSMIWNFWQKPRLVLFCPVRTESHCVLILISLF